METYFIPATVNAAAALRPVVDVFVGVGQSNCEGRGDSTLSPAVVSGLNLTSGAVVYPLADPVGGALTGSMWPAWANEWVARTGRMSAFVEQATGGTGLVTATTPNWSPTGTLRGAAVTAAQAAIAALSADARWTLGNVYFVWSQGEQDAAAAIGETAYRDALIALADYFKAQVPSMARMLIVRTGTRNDATLGAEFAAIRAAQDAACAARPDVLRMVYRGTASFTYGGQRLMADSVHYNQTGLNRAGLCAAREAAKATPSPVAAAPTLLGSQSFPDTDFTATTSRTVSHTTATGTRSVYVAIAVNRPLSASTNSGGSCTFGGVAMTRVNGPFAGTGGSNTSPAGRADVMIYRITEAEYGGSLSAVTANIVVTPQASSNIISLAAFNLDLVPIQADGVASALSGGTTGSSMTIGLGVGQPALAIGVASSVADAAAALTHTPPAGWTELVDAGASNGTRSGQAWIGHATLAEGFASHTLTISGTVTAGVFYGILLRAAIDGEA